MTRTVLAVKQNPKTVTVIMAKSHEEQARTRGVDPVDLITVIERAEDLYHLVKLMAVMDSVPVQWRDRCKVALKRL